MNQAIATQSNPTLDSTSSTNVTPPVISSTIYPRTFSPSEFSPDVPRITPILQGKPPFTSVVTLRFVVLSLRELEKV
jgi:hypothetical protein